MATSSNRERNPHKTRGEHYSEMTSDSMISLPQQTVVLERVEGTGLIIDIGGGGEGLVSRIEGERVCAVDINLNKVREARIHPECATWVTCDAQNLCFVDDAFETATMWFSLAYMPDWRMKSNCIRETYRVLRKGGRLLIHACRMDFDVERVIFPIDFIFPDGSKSRFGFRVRGQQNQTLEGIEELVKQAGFSVTKKAESRYLFNIEGRKN